MATLTGAARARCVFWLEETKSATQVQRKFRTQYRKRPPSRPKIYSWHKNFVETWCTVLHAKSPGRPCVSDAAVEQLRESVVRNPRQSTRRTSLVTGIPRITVWRLLRKRLHLKACKLSNVQHLTIADKVVRNEFCMRMFHRIQDYERFLDSVMRARFMSVLRSIPTSAGSGAVNIHVSPWNMFVTAQRWTCVAPSAKKDVRPLLVHGDGHYRYRVSGHAPTAPHSTVRQR
jgi:hypothetical protein